jgi:hypothetical protein
MAAIVQPPNASDICSAARTNAASHSVSSERSRYPQWPETCRHYEPHTMDPVDIGNLLYSDTEYLEPESAVKEILNSIDIADGTATLTCAPLARV